MIELRIARALNFKSKYASNMAAMC